MNIFNLSRLFSKSRNNIVDGLTTKRRIQIGRAAYHPPVSGIPSITLSHAQRVGIVREDNEDSLFALTGMNAGDSEQNNFGLFVNFPISSILTVDIVDIPNMVPIFSAAFAVALSP